MKGGTSMKKIYDITMVLTLIVVVLANLITMLYVNYLGKEEDEE
jgi:hypothetical protein